MTIKDIKSEKDFNIYKNGKNPAHLFTEVLSYLLAHVNKEHCCNEEVTNKANEVTNSPVKGTPKSKK